MTSEERTTAKGKCDKRLLAAGLIVCVIIALAATYYPVFDRATQQLYSTNRDALDIVAGAEGATGRDIAGWWTGPWIQTTSRFYRPLASMLMWAEYQLWGRDFQKYCVVSWLVHAIICALIFLLMFRLTRRQGTLVAIGLGVLAVVLFNLRRGIVGPGWPPACITSDGTRIPYRIAYGEMPYWPAQTDIFSLVFSLGSLLLLDLYAQRRQAKWLALAAGLFVIALLFKEMALVVVLLGPLLLWYRQRRLPLGCGRDIHRAGVDLPRRPRVGGAGGGESAPP